MKIKEYLTNFFWEEDKNNLKDMTYSFDIFDTCLIRKCGQPDIVFDLMAQRILGKDAEETQIMDFKMIRKNSENRARTLAHQKGREEISIDEIYDECDFSSLTRVSNDVIKQTELDVEKEQLVAVHSIKEKLADLRKVGEVLFISDMYLPQEFIKSILVEQGLFEEGDTLYVSSKIGLTKGSGNLFKYVKEKEGLKYKSWLHFGDNKWSDVKIPRKLGIKAKLASHEFNYYEKKWGRLVPIDSRQTNQICAAISKYIRLTSECKPEITIAADFIAPFYVSFVAWLMADAQKRGIKQLFFLARDGQIFYEIAKEFSDAYPSIKISYLYVSRKSLYLPGLDSISVADMENLVMGKALQHVLDCFQLEDCCNEFEKYNHLYGKSLFEALLKDDTFKSKISERQKEQRTLAIKYFEQEGLNKGDSAIIDLNGTRNCHKCICRILHRNGYSEPYGYFMSVSPNRVTGQGYSAMFFFDYEPSNKQRFTRNLPPTMMSEEYFSMANHPTTLSYKEEDGHIKPVLEEWGNEKLTKSEIYAINISVCRLYAQTYKKIKGSRDAVEICNRALYVITDFVFAPEYKLLSPFRDFTYSYTSLIKTKIIRRGSLYSLIKEKRKSNWFAGEFVDRFPIHSFATFILRIILFLRRQR